MLFNLPKQDKNSKDLSLKYRVYLAPMTSVDVDNYPKPEKATIKQKVLKADEKYNYLDGDARTLVMNVEPGENQFKGVPKVTIIIEGLTPDSLEYVYANAGEDFNMIVERCSDGQKFIMGDPCSGGMRMQYTSIGVLEGGNAGISVEFTGGQCNQPVLFYDAEFDVVADEAPVAPAKATVPKTS